MRKYRISAASIVRVDYGTELVAGLRRFSETAPLAVDFQKLNDDLFAQYLVRLAARKPMVAARVDVRFAGYDADQSLRACAHACEQADGCKGGPIFKSIFKDGLTAAVKPDGVQQIPATEKVIKAMKESAAPGIEGVRATWSPKVEASLSVLQGAAAGLTTAKKAYLDAFGAELAFRNQHWTAVDRIQGQVRTAFPGNTTRQDLIFPEQDNERDGPAEAAKPDPQKPE